MNKIMSSFAYVQRLSSACMLLLAVTMAAAAEPSVNPNVVFIVIDNVDFAHMGKCYGGDSLTPQLDRIAERGVKFTRAYATTPLCVPSRYTCLSGRYASRSQNSAGGETEDGEGGWNIELEKDLPNLPNVMHAAGYATGFVGKYHLEKEKYPRYAGKEASVFSAEADAWLKTRNAWLSDRIRQRGFDFTFNACDFRSSQFRGVDFEGGNHNMEADVLGALDFIGQNREKPFFLYLAPRLLHLPINPKLLLEDYSKMGRVTEGGLLPEAPQVPMPSRKEIHAAAQAAGATTPQQFGMHWLDCGIGAVVGRLDELKLLDNTLLIVFSDNNQRGKETLYEGGARVPLLAMWPRRLKPGNVCDHIVANTDFAPTIFDACGVQPPAGMVLDGRSFLPVVENHSAPWRDGLMLENGHTRAVVTGQWKYVALRYPPEVQAKIAEVERTGVYPRINQKAETFFNRFKKTLTPEQWKFARNSWRWHTPGNNYMKSIDDFPFQFDVDQLFKVSHASLPQDSENVAAMPENAAVLADMQARLKQLMIPLKQSFGEFGVPYATPPEKAAEKPRRKKRP